MRDILSRKEIHNSFREQSSGNSHRHSKARDIDAGLSYRDREVVWGEQRCMSSKERCGPIYREEDEL